MACTANPFRRPGRHRQAWSLVPWQAGTVLDYGCANGEFLLSLKPKSTLRYGCDVNREALQKARAGDPKAVFIEVEDGARVPLPTGSMDVVTMLDVLEHTGCERRVIGELHRVLRPNGLLILSVPHKGLFAWFDVGNVKFRFPALHRFIYRRILGESDLYSNRFRCFGNGICGDFSVSARRWHSHYSPKEIQKLLRPWFQILSVRRFAFIQPILVAVVYFWDKLGLPGLRAIQAMQDVDQGMVMGALAYNLILTARKSP